MLAHGCGNLGQSFRVYYSVLLWWQEYAAPQFDLHCEGELWGEMLGLYIVACVLLGFWLAFRYVAKQVGWRYLRIAIPSMLALFFVWDPPSALIIWLTLYLILGVVSAFMYDPSERLTLFGESIRKSTD